MKRWKRGLFLFVSIGIVVLGVAYFAFGASITLSTQLGAGGLWTGEDTSDPADEIIDAIHPNEDSWRVGIGTVAPSGTLDVQGGIAPEDQNGTNITLNAQDGGALGTATGTNGGNIILMPGNGVGTGSTGNVGIGTADPGNKKLWVRYSPIDNWGAHAIHVQYEPTVTINGDFRSRGISSYARPIVAAGTTNSGKVAAIYGAAHGESGFAGTLDTIYGILAQSGFYDGATGTITNSYGVFIQPQQKSGTITNSYSLYLDSPKTGGTVTNEWALYSEDDAPSYFAGNVGIGTDSPKAAALLDVSSTVKGFLPPRMDTTQRDAITSPPAGLMIYNTTTNKLNFYNGIAWEAVTST